MLLQLQKYLKPKKYPKRAGFGAAFWPFLGISLALDTFGVEATCSSPDVVAVSTANRACFVAFWLTTGFGAAFWPFLGISLALDTFGVEATCSSPDVVALSSANRAHFVAFCLTTGFGAAFGPFWVFLWL